jgi:Uma2 family endonuclease
LELLEKIELTETQIKKIERGGIVAISATWDEFWDFLEETKYKVEYCNGKIIITGLAAAIHEYLVMWISTLFNNHFQRNGYLVFGSNLGVKTGDNKGYFNPDITIVKGKLEFFNNSKAIITNPYLVVEVVSEAGYHYDMYEKLGKYQHTESIQEVIMVDRFDKEVIKFQRTPNPKVWTETIYDHENFEILIDTMKVNLNDIFDKLSFFEE